jgi:putative RecB family exonuclease
MAATLSNGDPVANLEVAASTAASPTATSRVRWHSVSSTREYERCPRRYRYAYVDRLPQDRPVPVAWRIGSAIHAALESAYRTKQDHPEQPLVAGLPCALVGLRRSWDALDLPYGDDRYRQAGRHLEKTLRSDILDAQDIVGVELPLRDRRATGHRLAGFLDLLLRRDATTLEVVDHKVTSHRATELEIATDLQLNLYGALVRVQWPEATAVRATLHYPTGPDRVTTTLTDEGMQAARTRVERTAQRAAADTAFEPRPAAHCDHCPWLPRCPAHRRASPTRPRPPDRPR